MNEAKIAVTIAALLITGAFGGYAFKNLDTDDIVTDKITTVETVKELTPEEDKAEVETVELTKTTDDTQAKRVFLERSQSSIRSTVVHIESDDCVYADEEAAEDVQVIIEAEPQASQAEVKNDESEAQAAVAENSEASQTDETENISVRYDYFNADVSFTSTDESSEDEEESSLAEAFEDESESDEDESSEAVESEELEEDEDSEDDLDDSISESESTEEIEEAEDSVEEETDVEMTESEEEAPLEDEDENSAEDDEEESLESEETSQEEEAAEEEEEQDEEPETSTGISVTQSEYYMLCNVVAHEYGSDWVSEYDKALVVEVIMNRVNSPKYPNSIYGVLTQPYQFSGMQSYITLGGFSSQVTESVKAAVDLYLSDPSQFNHGYYSFWGDGYRNHFY